MSCADGSHCSLLVFRVFCSWGFPCLNSCCYQRDIVSHYRYKPKKSELNCHRKSPYSLSWSSQSFLETQNKLHISSLNSNQSHPTKVNEFPHHRRKNNQSVPSVATVFDVKLYLHHKGCNTWDAKRSKANQKENTKTIMLYKLFMFTSFYLESREAKECQFVWEKRMHSSFNNQQLVEEERRSKEPGAQWPKVKVTFAALHCKSSRFHFSTSLTYSIIVLAAGQKIPKDVTRHNRNRASPWNLVNKMRLTWFLWFRFSWISASKLSISRSEAIAAVDAGMLFGRFINLFIKSIFTTDFVWFFV